MMKYCKCFVPLVALACTFGFADTAKAELGACCVPAGGCVDDQSSTTCDEALDGAYLGDGTTCATDDCPDCDCSGENDVKMIADCISACPGTCSGLPAGPVYDACIAACEAECTMENLCPSTNEGYPWSGYCCDQATGDYLYIPDAYGCTDDVCHADGSVSHDTNDALCDDGNECTTDTCVPGCSNVAVTDGTTCGDANDDDCDNPDSCLAGVCADNYESWGTPCPDDGDPCTVDRCNGAGTCTHPGGNDGDPCADDGEECTADYCGAGICTHPGWPNNGNECTEDGDECTQDVCSGGSCTHPLESPGTPCGDPADTECSNPDSCTSLGACSPRDEASGTFCGNGNNVPDICSSQDTCDGSGGCTNNLFAAGVPCRSPADACDAQDYCDGVIEECVDDKAPDGTACPGDGNPCTKNLCDGDGNCEHPFQDAGHACGDQSTARCDDANSCDGAGDCLENHKPVNYMCRAAVGVCDEDDHCTDTQACPNDKKAAGTLCRAPGAGGGDPECDVEEVCDGVNNACPTDLYVSFGTACTDDSEQCTNDYCAGGKCYHIELADWTPCPDGDGDVCTRDDRCRTGLGCIGYDVNPCDDGDLCTIDACDQDHQDADQDGCYWVYGGGPAYCDLLVKIVPTGSGPITSSYQKGCFTAEVYAMDASAEGNGLNCVFVDLEFGEDSCPLSVMDLGDPINLDFDFQVKIDSAFPDFNRWYVEPPLDVLDFGGCTNMSGYGVGVWVLLGTVEVIAPNLECCAPLDIVQATFEESSLIGLGPKVAHEADESVDEVCTDCWGDLYDSWPPGDGFINAGDLSIFAECWEECTPACAAFNYDMSVDGCVGPGDLGFFATAWQEFVCAGGIIIPAVQMHCDGYDWGPGPGGAAGTANGVKLLDNGNVVEVQVLPASVEMIKSFGLTVPERLVAPPDNDRLTPKDRKRAGVRSR